MAGSTKAYKYQQTVGAAMADCLRPRKVMSRIGPIAVRQWIVAEFYGCTREYIRQTENTALYKLVMRWRAMGLTLDELLIACGEFRQKHMLQRAVESREI